MRFIIMNTTEIFCLKTKSKFWSFGFKMLYVLYKESDGFEMKNFNWLIIFIYLYHILTVF